MESIRQKSNQEERENKSDSKSKQKTVSEAEKIKRMIKQRKTGKRISVKL